MKNKQIDIAQLSPAATLIDTHCHLDMDAYAHNLEEIVRKAADQGVKRIITVGIDLESSHRAVGFARLYPGVYATVGIHPHNAVDGNPEVYEQLNALSKDKTNKVVGYGEIGLDFARNYAPREIQITCFRDQIRTAKNLGLPIIVHDRDAHTETLDILGEQAPFPAGGVMHCFSGDIELARAVIAIGLHISIPGIVTFNKSEIMQQVAQEMPIDRMILETDGPFLAPVPFRGKTNMPEYLLHTARKIAELRGISLDDVARQTTLNAETLFQLPSWKTES